MKPSDERAELVFQCFARGLRYQAAANELNLDKNEIYQAVTLLLKQGRIVKVGPGQYSTDPNVAVPYSAPPKKRNTVIDFPTPAPPPPPEPEPIAQADVEEVATDLLDKIGALQPLLLLHKDLFTGIEKSVMQLVELIIDLKPRILTSEQLAEYKEFVAMKERALILAKQKQYKQR